MKRVIALLSVAAACGRPVATEEDGGGPASTGTLPSRPTSDGAAEASPRPPPSAREAGVSDPTHPTVGFPVKGAWRHLPVAPEWCQIAISEEPEIAFPGFDWSACPRAVPGCDAVVFGREGAYTRGYLFTPHVAPEFEREGIPQFGFLLPYRSGQREGFEGRLYVTGPLEGPAAFVAALGPGAYRDSQSCAMNYGVSATQISGSFTIRRKSESGEETDERQLWTMERGNVESMRARPFPDVIPPPIYASVAFENVFFAQYQGQRNFTHALVNPADWAVTMPVVDGVEPSLFEPRKARDGFVFLGRARGEQSLFHFSKGGVVRRLLNATPGRQIAFHGVDASNDDALVWVDGTVEGETLKDLRMWTAPFPAPPTMAQPREVAQLAQIGTTFSVNAGVALVMGNDDHVKLVRLSDGKAWAIPANPEFTYINPLWVDEHHVWLFATTAVTSPTPVWHGNALVRYARAALGEPTLGNGLN